MDIDLDFTEAFDQNDDWYINIIIINFKIYLILEILIHNSGGNPLFIIVVNIVWIFILKNKII